MRMNTKRARRAIDALASLSGLAIGAIGPLACGSTAAATAQAPVGSAHDGGTAADATALATAMATATAPDAGLTADPPTEASDSPDASDDDAASDAAPVAPATPDSGAQTSSQGGPTTCGFSACAPGAPCPDLVVDLDDLRASTVIETQTFAATDCAIVEGCILTPGTRRLLRFDTAAANIGTADLTIGDPTMNACFQYSDCHMHYHFRGVGQYTLYASDGTTVAAVGHKQGFCLEDVEQYNAAPGPNPATPYTCQDQGLHVGWEDVYPADIDCQWIDITGVAAGDYVLSVLINGEHYLPESNYANNEARVPVTIPPQ
jgi:hypothetical protein